MVEAYLVPTDYEQPKPIDGKYSAIVYKTYAEFEYKGYKVIANMSAQGAMNANGNAGVVTVNGDNVDISWDGSANSLDDFMPQQKRSISTEKQLIATLKPLEFDQRYPFYGSDVGCKGRVFGVRAEFGVLDKYVAVIDGHVQSSVLGAPCLILPKKDDRQKCIIEFDDATIFMVKRYGRDTYDNLVEKTANELQKLLHK